jgi:hypothetical protein
MALNLVNINKPKPSRPRTKTVFVDNFFYSRANQRVSVEVVPHLGLMSLASMLEGAGQQVEILDPKILFAGGQWQEPGGEFLDAWAADLLGRRADIIGFSAYGRSLPYVIRVARRIKQADPAQKVVLGGPHATIMGEQILKHFSCFDAVVRYEAEPLIVDIVSTLARGQDPYHIPNMVCRSGSEVVATPRQSFLPEVDNLPELALHLYPIDRLRPAELSIEAGRGCPFDCTFCSTSRFFQRRYRLKSNARMLHEMERARARYGISMFNLNHDLFGLVKKSVYEFCEMAMGRDFQWKCSMRPDTVDPRMVAELQASGCRYIYFGVETGSQRLQKVIRKNLKLERTRATLREVVGHGIHCTTSFITGFPEESEIEQDETLDFIGDMLKIDPQRVAPQLHVLSPEPGSHLAESNSAYSYDGIGPEVDEFLDDELIRAHPDVFSVFYHYESLTPRWRTILASAFVTHLVPELGYPLTLHLIINFFSGSLAKLFRATVREAPARTMPYRSVIQSLHDGLNNVVTSLTGDAPYLRDLVKLSRTLSAIRRVAESRPSGDARQLSKATWLARFDHDVLGLAQAILDDPGKPIQYQRPATEERWLLLRYDAADRLVTGVLEPEAGRWLHHAGRQQQPLPGEYAQLFDDLGVQFVEC